MLGLKTFTFSPIQENTYVLYNEGRQCCIIDPGCYFPEEREQLKAAIEEAGWSPVLLLNTHCHLDHVFGNKFVSDTWGLIPHIHPMEQQVLARAGISGERWQLPFDNYDGELAFIDEGDEVLIGQESLRVLFTPGHSPGSVSFYYEPGQFVLGGDVLFNRSIGRTDLPGGDQPTLIESIHRKMFTLPDDTKVWSGHGPVTTIGFEKMNNPFVKIY